MADTWQQPYQLNLPLRVLIAFPYLICSAIWLVNTHATPWVLISQYIASFAFLLGGYGWIFACQRRRLTQYCAWLPVFTIFLTSTLWATQGQWLFGLLLGLMPIFFLLSGAGSYLRHRDINGVPPVSGSWKLALKLAFDELMLGYFVSASSTPRARRVVAIADEVHVALDVMQRNGWLDNPASFHVRPQELSSVELINKTALGLNYEELQFTSQYQAHDDLPGSKRWMAYESTHKVHARIFEHQDASRPWLMCIHGYRMGWPYMDFQLFSPGWLHHKLGFNLIMPLLPLHGHRKEGFRSGDGFFEGDLLNLVHAEGQAQSDLRACIHWLRKHREVSRLGVYGISLGGLNASLLGCLEPDIDSLIAGIPLVDPGRVFELNAPASLVNGFEKKGVTVEMIKRLLKPVSPLEMQSQLPVNTRAIIAGSHDRIVPLAPIVKLHEHWGDCRINWYPGTHLSVRREAIVSQWLQDIWQSHGLLAQPKANQNQGDLVIE